MQTSGNSICLRLQQTTFEQVLSSETSVFDPFWDLSKPHLAVRETGKDNNNPHQHWFFYLQHGKKVSALRKALNRKGIKGKNSYMLKAGKPEKIDDHFDYLCKGISSKKEDDVDIIQRSEDFTDAIIDQRHDVYHKVADRLPEKKRKIEVNAAKMIGELEVSMRKKPRFPHGRRDMIKLAMRWYYENKTSINVHHLRTVTNHVSYGIVHDQPDNEWDMELDEHQRYIRKMEHDLVNKTE